MLEYDIRIGNLCNLRCKMCNPGESTKWYDEWMDTMFDGFKSDFASLDQIGALFFLDACFNSVTVFCTSFSINQFTLEPKYNMYAI